MGLHVGQLTQYVIEPALDGLGMYSPGAAALVLGTMIHESQGLRYIHQKEGGPALGLCQMEPATHRDIWRNFLEYRPLLIKKLQDLCPGASPDSHALLMTDLLYMSAMCRLQYRRYPDAIPDANDIAGAAALWKNRYNTVLGKGKESEYVENWHRVMG